MSSGGCCNGGGCDDKEYNPVYDSVKNYYGKVLQSSGDLKTSACTTASRPHDIIMDALSKVPKEITDKYYGCGTPLPFGIEGLSVCDLGSGSGRDCYVAADLVGPKGSVVGVDMTEEQLQVARDNIEPFAEKLGYKPNMRFVKGYIEFLQKAGVEDNSLDLVISNCVVNLSPDKPRVIQGVFNALREGGEFYFSDVYCDRRLPENIQTHDVLLGECLGGAMYIEDFKRACHKAGFADPRQLSIEPIIVHDKELKDLLGNAKFYSITYRLFKISSLETLCEDYGQVATYLGTIPGHKHSYALDDHHEFITGKPMLVCGNSASMVGDSWLGKHFKVVGDRSTHFGLFDCAGPAVPAPAAPTGDAPPAGGCC